MITLDLPKIVKGEKLVEVIESAMDDLEGFDVTREPNCGYGLDSKPFEAIRLIEARKKLRWYDPITAVHEGIFPLIGPVLYVIPFIGQGLYFIMLLNRDCRRCVIKTKIELKKEYKSLDITVCRGLYIDVNYESSFYEFVKDDVERFISNLIKRLKNQ